jgi:hypothetical protein
VLEHPIFFLLRNDVWFIIQQSGSTSTQNADDGMGDGTNTTCPFIVFVTITNLQNPLVLSSQDNLSSETLSPDHNTGLDLFPWPSPCRKHSPPPSSSSSPTALSFFRIPIATARLSNGHDESGKQ